MKVRELFDMIWRRLWIVIVFTTVVTSAVGIYSYYYITPVYGASVELLVMPNSAEEAELAREIDFNDIQTSIKLMDTYQVMIKSPRVLEKAMIAMKLRLSTTELDSKIEVKPVKSSQVIEITVRDPSPVTAVEVANTLSRISVEEIKEIMKIDNIQVISEAKVSDNPYPVYPRPILNIAMAFVVGFFLSIALVLVYDSYAIYRKSRVLQKQRMMSKSALG
ncbi:YveK family protein [Brevibacillus centrosporus]|jgi:capsular polysaccharide biosynthesis protein|uniref:YveK family protein n=1 Tax=Brevibacillus centrosporus TaxID=54910 RepID=UPI000F0A18F0|nr:Wzz/FepE/Etk N-terminal domain-containing protein [Brevibacillus centrosporus]MEC2130737.1 Wzz/FepE/Etk N-terminal domain-containing protein [Brevibacillus centrosporus]RNB69230.1 capsule biosynthesis protein [Brevibacillus centrosporus]GED32169.1 putative capsular polysaccharide biosynthesis protein YwqC [Brevibacillus centrosporus]